MADTPRTIRVRVEPEWDPNSMTTLAAALDEHTEIDVGRIVHYRSRGSADGVFAPECRAAVVTEAAPDYNEAVKEASWVSLAVLNPTGLFFHEKLFRDISGTGGTWHRTSECQERSWRALNA